MRSHASSRGSISSVWNVFHMSCSSIDIVASRASSRGSSSRRSASAVSVTDDGVRSTACVMSTDPHSRNASGDARGRRARTLPSVDERPGDVSRAHRYPARVRVSPRSCAPGVVRAPTVKRRFRAYADADEVAASEASLLSALPNFFALRNVLPSEQTVRQKSGPNLTYSIQRGESTIIQTPSHPTEPTAGKAPVCQNFRTKNQLRFYILGHESTEREDFSPGF